MDPRATMKEKLQVLIVLKKLHKNHFSVNKKQFYSFNDFCC